MKEEEDDETSSLPLRDLNMLVLRVTSCTLAKADAQDHRTFHYLYVAVAVHPRFLALRAQGDTRHSKAGHQTRLVGPVSVRFPRESQKDCVSCPASEIYPQTPAKTLCLCCSRAPTRKDVE